MLDFLKALGSFVLSAACQGFIPFLIAYFAEMSALKKPADTGKHIKDRWLLLPTLAFLALSLMLFSIPPLEGFGAALYIFAVFAVILAVFVILGRRAARSDFRRKQRKKLKTENTI